jgi:YbbR domain-containing protein
MKLRLPQFVRHDLMRKLVAMFFALLLWLTISAQLRATMSLHNVPVALQFNPAETIIESDVPTVGVTVRGTPHALEQIKSNDIQIAAEVLDAAPGMYFTDIPISRRNIVRVPPGIRVVDIDRRVIQVRLDRIVSRKDIPINLRFEGKIRDGYRITRRSVVPSRMDIRGPHRIVRDISEVTTEPILLDDTIVRDFDVEVALTPIPGVEMGRTVHVTVQVARTSSQKNYADLPMTVLARPGSPLVVKGELPRVAVTAYGPQTALDRLAPGQIHAFVDLSRATSPGQVAATVQVWIDGDTEVSVGYVHPATVNLELVPAAPAPPPPEKAPAAPAPPAHAPNQ